MPRVTQPAADAYASSFEDPMKYSSSLERGFVILDCFTRSGGCSESKRSPWSWG
jgi:hypothetical protein